jgi:hypothetical protein
MRGGGRYLAQFLAGYLAPWGRSRDGVMGEKATNELLPVMGSTRELPPILVGRYSPAVEAQVRNFYESVGQVFERWVTRRSSRHTQRAYRRDVLAFVEFLADACRFATPLQPGTGVERR